MIQNGLYEKKPHRVLVPIIEEIPSEHAIELACRLGNGQKTELVLVHLIIVPLALPLDAPMPAQDEIAQHVIDLGCRLAEQFGCQSRTRLLRHRNAADGILQVAQQERVDAIVLGVGSERERIPGEWDQTSVEVMHRAECEVIVDKVPRAITQLANERMNQ